MKCAELKNLVPLYLNGRLDTEQLDEFAGHLIACRKCEDEVFLYCAMKKEEKSKESYG